MLNQSESRRRWDGKEATLKAFPGLDVGRFADLSAKVPGEFANERLIGSLKRTPVPVQRAAVPIALVPSELSSSRPVVSSQR